MESVVVIANPVASQFTGGDHRSVMAELSRVYDVEAMWPGSASESTAVAADAAAAGVHMVVAIGGDGMVHHVAQGLVDTATTLAVIPAGTTNVVARLLDMPSRQTKAAKLVARTPIIDRVGTVKLALRRGTTQTEHHVVFACGFGLDAEVVQVADSDPYRKYRFGSLHYARSAIGVGLKSFPSRRAHLQIDAGEDYEGVAALIQFREVYSFFGKVGLRFNDNRPDPMSLLVVETLKRRRVPRIFLSAVTHRDLDNVTGFSVVESLDRIEVDADPPVAVQADGENLGLVDGGTATWEPSSLKVVRGSNSSD